MAWAGQVGEVGVNEAKGHEVKAEGAGCQQVSRCRRKKGELESVDKCETRRKRPIVKISEETS